MTAKLPLPDTQPTEMETATIEYPKSDFWRGVVRGALHELTFPFLWDDGAIKEDTLQKARDIEMSLQEFSPIDHTHSEYALPGNIHLYGVLSRWAGAYGQNIQNLGINNTWFAVDGISSVGDPSVASDRSTESEFYIEQSGYYRITAAMMAYNGDSTRRDFNFAIFKNSTLLQQMNVSLMAAQSGYYTAERDYVLLQANDYLQVKYWLNASVYIIYRTQNHGRFLAVERVG